MCKNFLNPDLGCNNFWILSLRDCVQRPWAKWAKIVIQNVCDLNEGKRKAASDQPLDVKELWPLTISCLWWRVLSRCICRHKSMVEWLGAVLPENCMSGRPGININKGLRRVMADVYNQRCALGLDLEKAFDRVNPKVLHQGWLRLRIDPLVAKVLHENWANQWRTG